jgi:hypothetical protein
VLDVITREQMQQFLETGQAHQPDWSVEGVAPDAAVVEDHWYVATKDAPDSYTRASDQLAEKLDEFRRLVTLATQAIAMSEAPEAPAASPAESRTP